MANFGKIDATTDAAKITELENEAAALVADGFTPNPFACKLPLSDDLKGTITAKDFRKWEKNGNKGLILSLTAIFQTPTGDVTDKVTLTDFEQWKSFKIEGKISVSVENKATKNEKYAKLKQETTTV